MASDAGEAAPAQMIDLFADPGGMDVAAHWLGISVHGVEWTTTLMRQGKLRDCLPRTKMSAT